MNYKQFRYFVAVVDADSITHAANHLHLVQSALSHQLAQLERELGLPLLVRGRRGVAPTTARTLLHRQANATLRHLEAAMGSTGEVAGTVNTRLPNSMVPLIAVPLLQAAGMPLLPTQGHREGARALRLSSAAHPTALS